MEPILGGIKQYKSMVKFVDFLYNSELFGLVSYNDSYLEGHPRTGKWLVTMVIVSPLRRVVPLPNGLHGL